MGQVHQGEVQNQWSAKVEGIPIRYLDVSLPTIHVVRKLFQVLKIGDEVDLIGVPTQVGALRKLRSDAHEQECAFNLLISHGRSRGP